MSKNEICPLCGNISNLLNRKNSFEYFQCPVCDAVFMSKDNLPTRREEIDRYRTHNNDVNDIRYQNFVRDIVDAVLMDFDKNTLGLDYGAGTGPVISKMLKDRAYKVNQYDPLFHQDKSIFNFTYNYIVCCEVIEHFFNPQLEFENFKNLLKQNGKIYCKTDLYDSEIDFENWYYSEDPTHVFFYTKNTLNWIKEKYEFTSLEIKDRLIIFTN